MRKWLRIIVWLGMMFFMGMISAISAAPFGPQWPMFFMPFFAGLITMFIWQVLEIRIGPKTETRHVEPAKAKRQRMEGYPAERLQRLVDDLDDNELIELETLLLARDEH